MTETHNVLKELKPQKEFFIGIDSDGCAFDTMEIKQKECFCPNFILFFEMQKISRYARETWEFVNLYSKNRGVNRFPALVEVIRLLSERQEVSARNMILPDMSALSEWIRVETKLGNPSLKLYEKKAGDPIITKTYNWSVQVNRDISRMVSGVPPFPYVRESLNKLSQKADAMVVSQTPLEALEREWKENEIAHLVRMIAGQEYGTKTEHLAFAAKNKYPDHKILMIGDAYGDLKAAKSNNVLFYPVNPGHEEESWKRFYSEALPRFFDQKYQGPYESELIREFQELLPENPPWKK